MQRLIASSSVTPAPTWLPNTPPVPVSVEYVFLHFQQPAGFGVVTGTQFGSLGSQVVVAGAGVVVASGHGSSSYFHSISFFGVFISHAGQPASP